MAAQQLFQLSAIEPALPFGGFQLAPMFGVLIDNCQFSPWTENPAHFAHSPFDIDRVLQRFGGVDAVKSSVRKRKFAHNAGNSIDPRGHRLQHPLGYIQTCKPGRRIPLQDDPGIAPLTAADIQNSVIVYRGEMPEQNLNVLDPRIDAGREVFFIPRRFIETLADVAAQLIVQL